MANLAPRISPQSDIHVGPISELNNQPKSYLFAKFHACIRKRTILIFFGLIGRYTHIICIAYNIVDPSGDEVFSISSGSICYNAACAPFSFRRSGWKFLSPKGSTIVEKSIPSTFSCKQLPSPVSMCLWGSRTAVSWKSSLSKSTLDRGRGEERYLL